MKILVSVLTFAFTLALTSISVAEEAHVGGHENLPEKMNSLFPQPQPQLTKRQVPAKPELANPAFNSQVNGNKISLQWKQVSGADEYHVQVATDSTFKWLVAEDFHVKATSYEVVGLTAGTKYYWRVAAVNTQNWNTFRKSFFAMNSFYTAGTAPAAQVK
ncbi:MAG: fibronectin type III domain-containing protein [Pseudobdellovibrionaceae bacterium]